MIEYMSHPSLLRMQDSKQSAVWLFYSQSTDWPCSNGETTGYTKERGLHRVRAWSEGGQINMLKAVRKHDRDKQVKRFITEEEMKAGAYGSRSLEPQPLLRHSASTELNVDHNRFITWTQPVPLVPLEVAPARPLFWSLKVLRSPPSIVNGLWVLPFWSLAPPVNFLV